MPVKRMAVSIGANLFNHVKSRALLQHMQPVDKTPEPGVLTGINLWSLEGDVTSEILIAKHI
jgi:hypothetical protein